MARNVPDAMTRTSAAGRARKPRNSCPRSPRPRIKYRHMHRVLRLVRVLFALLVAPFPAVSAVTKNFDVVLYGGTAAGVVTAISAARAGGQSCIAGTAQALGWNGHRRVEPNGLRRQGND